MSYRRKKLPKLKPIQMAILLTLRELNDMDLYPLPRGIQKIISGSRDEEFLKYKDLIAYSTFLSFSEKKISCICGTLSRHGYINDIYDENTCELYLTLSPTGRQYLNEFYYNRKPKFKKKIAKSLPSIVKIEN